jgi:hypothetical protein
VAKEFDIKKELPAVEQPFIFAQPLSGAYNPTALLDNHQV